MPACSLQLRLFPAPQPLVERLGVEFFLSAPRAPGVYQIFDAHDRLIYVGKARDLRARLNSYRRTHGQSRKTIRLIHEARRIAWEICSSEAEARLRENALIRSLRPRFNRAGVWPRSARFIQLAEVSDGFSLFVTADPTGESYGAFRAGAGMAVAAFARLFWMASRQTSEARQLPRDMLPDVIAVARASAPPCAEWAAQARAFLAGDGDQILGLLIDSLPQPESAFDLMFLATQFEILMDFYRRGPVRNARLRRLLPETRRALSPEEHDDLLAWAASQLETAAARNDAPN